LWQTGMMKRMLSSYAQANALGVDSRVSSLLLAVARASRSRAKFDA
jgi:hypothetical protein